jgi:hypothetical protein
MKGAARLLFVLAGAAACHPSVAPPSPAAPAPRKWEMLEPQYPALLLRVHVAGDVIFDVRTDSAGHPDLSTFVARRNSNQLFVDAVRDALRAARGAPSLMVRDTVYFEFYYDAADSTRACAPTGGATIVCVRGQPSVHREAIG